MTSFKGTVKEIEKTDRTMLKYGIKNWTEMDLASTILNKIAFASIRKKMDQKEQVKRDWKNMA